MFLISVSDLEKRRNLCRPDAERLLRSEWETVGFCNVCSSPRNVIIAATDRYGLPERTALCLDCGLIYLVDRFTPVGYSRFYSSGSYRDICSRWNKVDFNVQQIQSDQRGYAATLTAVLSGYVAPCRDGKLLDIGGSAGIVASEFAKKFALHGTVLDPAEDEVVAARSLGLDGVAASLEEYETDKRYDLILLCRSIEHLNDLRGSFQRVHKLLKPGGLFYCDIADFMESCRLIGGPEAVAKIDHCYWLTQATAIDIFRALGFELVSMNIVFGFGYAGYLLRPCEPHPIRAISEERIQKQIEQIRSIQLAWTESDNASRGLLENLRHRAYRAKRKIQRLVARNNKISAQAPRRRQISESASVRPSYPSGVDATQVAHKN